MCLHLVSHLRSADCINTPNQTHHSHTATQTLSLNAFQCLFPLFLLSAKQLTQPRFTANIILHGHRSAPEERSLSAFKEKTKSVLREKSTFQEARVFYCSQKTAWKNYFPPPFIAACCCRSVIGWSGCGGGLLVGLFDKEKL